MPRESPSAPDGLTRAMPGGPRSLRGAGGAHEPRDLVAVGGEADIAADRRGRPLRIVDVAMSYDETSGNVRGYLDAKARHARATGAFEHHLLVRGPSERHVGGRHELPGLRVVCAGGGRVQVGSRALGRTLAALRPDVVMLHDPPPLGIIETARAVGAKVVAVHPRPGSLAVAGTPGSSRGWAPVSRGWRQRAYAGVDAIAAPADLGPDCGLPVTFPLRIGVHEAFRPRPGRVRADHVLCVGRLTREKGVGRLLKAAASSDDAWPLRIVGGGPDEGRLRRRACALGIDRRVSFSPHVGDPHRLARAYAGAACVVVPGEHETYGLVAVEAAACGAPVVVCSTAPSAAAVAPMAHTFAPADTAGLLAAITRARAANPDPFAAAALGGQLRWERCFERELEDLRELVL